MYYKITYSGDWAGDMDICAVMIVDEEKCEEFKANLDALEKFKKDNDDSLPTIMIGTNEEIEIDSPEFHIEELGISEVDYDLLKKLEVNQFDPCNIFEEFSFAVEDYRD